MVDLKANPFNLNDEQIKWVEDTYNSMSLDEKIGQLFVLLKAIPGVNEELIKGTLDQFHQGGFVGREEIRKQFIFRIQHIRRTVRYLFCGC